MCLVNAAKSFVAAT